MAKKRRKIDKIKAKQKLSTQTLGRTGKVRVQGSLSKSSTVTQDEVITFFNYDPKLISQDLKKTLIVVLVVLVVLALITLRYT